MFMTIGYSVWEREPLEASFGDLVSVYTPRHHMSVIQSHPRYGLANSSRPIAECIMPLISTSITLRLVDAEVAKEPWMP